MRRPQVLEVLNPGGLRKPQEISGREVSNPGRLRKTWEESGQEVSLLAKEALSGVGRRGNGSSGGAETCGGLTVSKDALVCKQ